MKMRNSFLLAVCFSLALPVASAAGGFGNLFSFPEPEPVPETKVAEPQKTTSVQSGLHAIPSLDGPYGYDLPSLEELRDLGVDADIANILPPERPADRQEPSPAANEPKTTPTARGMNPLRAPVRGQPGKGRFTRRLQPTSGQQPARDGGHDDKEAFEPQGAAPLIPGYQLSPARPG